MTTLMIVAHEPLASALGVVARHVFPDCAERLIVVDVNAQLSLADATELIEQAIGRVHARNAEGTELLVLADVLGATPANAASAAAVKHSAVRVLAGVNVPMLWRTLCYSTEALDDLVLRAQEGGMRGISEVRADNKGQAS